MFGAGDGVRTRDIDLGKVALYQLSYSRPPISVYSAPSTGVNNERFGGLTAHWIRLKNKAVRLGVAKSREKLTLNPLR